MLLKRLIGTTLNQLRSTSSALSRSEEKLAGLLKDAEDTGGHLWSIVEELEAAEKQIKEIRGAIAELQNTPTTLRRRVENHIANEDETAYKEYMEAFISLETVKRSTQQSTDLESQTFLTKLAIVKLKHQQTSVLGLFSHESTQHFLIHQLKHNCASRISGYIDRLENELKVLKRVHEGAVSERNNDSGQVIFNAGRSNRFGSKLVTVLKPRSRPALHSWIWDTVSDSSFCALFHDISQLGGRSLR